jgi:hypothetical protein
VDLKYKNGFVPKLKYLSQIVRAGATLAELGLAAGNLFSVIPNFLALYGGFPP